MRTLLPPTGLLTTPGSEPVEADLLRAYNWPARYWVRACMVHTADGSAVGPDGLSGSISSKVDRAVFNACRALCDAYVVGEGTVRAERYQPTRADPALRDVRLAAGQNVAPTLVIVSASASLNWSEATFRGSAQPPILVTVRESDPALRDAARAFGCEVVVLGEGQVDPADLLHALAERGLARITVEGGPLLLRSFVRADMLDEMDLTISPTLTAAPAEQRLGGAVLRRLRLAQLMEDDGFLFARYVRQGPDEPGAHTRAGVVPASTSG